MLKCVIVNYQNPQTMKSFENQSGKKNYLQESDSYSEAVTSIAVEVKRQHRVFKVIFFFNVIINQDLHGRNKGESHHQEAFSRGNSKDCN